MNNLQIFGDYTPEITHYFEPSAYALLESNLSPKTYYDFSLYFKRSTQQRDLAVGLFLFS